MANPHLPQEILIDIFFGLPTKSIGKCRCLSKPWRSLLSTPQFIKSHLNRRTHQENLILITPSTALRTISTIIDDTVSKRLEPTNTWNAVVGSCDGLVLLVNQEDEMFLVNPITEMQVKIPDSSLALKKNESFRMHGFGYDSSSDDYKIVTLSYYNTDNEYEPDCIHTFVDVCSVKRGVWKRVKSSRYDHAVPELASGAFVSGAIHWLASSRERGYPSAIVAFDFVEEVFNEIPAPSDIDRTSFVFNRLVVLGGCLCMVDTRTTTELWMLKEYDKKESWKKYSIYDDDDEWEIVKPLCFIGDEQVVLVTVEDSLVVYNLEDRCWKDMVVDGVPAMFFDGITFTESLVPPAFGNQIEGGIQL